MGFADNRLIEKIISGGQTGADRAGLDFAIQHNIPHGGWCPKGRLAEDGVIDRRYRLMETSTKQYPQRTEKNVQEADGTVIFTMSSALSRGSAKTAQLAIKHGRPLIHLHKGISDLESSLLKFLVQHHIKVLNVAGSRASKEPDIYDLVQQTLKNILVSRFQR